MVTDPWLVTRIEALEICSPNCPPTLVEGEDIGLGTTTNSGVIEFADPSMNGYKVLTTDHYVGLDGSTMIFNTHLGDDHSPTDLMHVTENTSGLSDVIVRNTDGIGDLTTGDGIMIIQVDGLSDGHFNLLGDYEIDGQQAVIAGAYGYTLWKNGIADPQDGDWYLRSQRADGDTLYQPGVPVYEVYPQVLLGLNGLPTLQQRVGNRYWKEPEAPTETVFCKDAASNFRCAVTADQDRYYADSTAGVKIDGSGVWGLVEASHSRFRPQVSTSGTDHDLDMWRLRAGIDGLLSESDKGKLIGGLNAHYGHGSADVKSLFGDGKIGTDAYGIGATATWYGTNGFYLDAQGQLTWFDSNLSSSILGTLVEGNKGFGYALSLEAGKRIDMGEHWALTPQGQLVYSNVRFDDFTDPYGAHVSLGQADSLRARLGLALEHQASWTDGQGEVERASIYGIGNLHYEVLDGTSVNVSGATLLSENASLWGEIGLGGTYQWGDDKYSLYGEVSASTSLKDFGDSYTLGGRLGLRVQW